MSNPASNASSRCPTNARSPTSSTSAASARRTSAAKWPPRATTRHCWPVPDGEIAEGAITNVGFIDGDTVVWPDAAPYLRGITLQVLEREFVRAGVPQDRRPLRLTDVASYDGAFLANSRGTAVISEIDGVPLPTHTKLLSRVGELYESAPWDAI